MSPRYAAWLALLSVLLLGGCGDGATHHPLIDVRPMQSYPREVDPAWLAELPHGPDTDVTPLIRRRDGGREVALPGGVVSGGWDSAGWQPTEVVARDAPYVVLARALGGESVAWFAVDQQGIAKRLDIRGFGVGPDGERATVSGDGRTLTVTSRLGQTSPIRLAEPVTDANTRVYWGEHGPLVVTAGRTIQLVDFATGTSTLDPGSYDAGVLVSGRNGQWMLPNLTLGLRCIERRQVAQVDRVACKEDVSWALAYVSPAGARVVVSNWARDVVVLDLDAGVAREVPFAATPVGWEDETTLVLAAYGRGEASDAGAPTLLRYHLTDGRLERTSAPGIPVVEGAGRR